GSQSRERLDKVLSELLPEVSRATVQRWIEEGRVTVNGGACRARDRVRPGQSVEVVPAAPPPTHAVGDPSVRFDVLYEDEYLLVVNKPAGLVVHPAKGHADGTLVNGLVARYDWDWPEDDPSQDPAVIRPGIVHRIDKDTSGILVVARTEQAREGLKEQLQAHQMGRKYLAITIGAPRVTTIRTAYGRHPRSRLKFTSLVREGKLAITHVCAVEVLATGAAALVECRLETGRTHQIRVHLSEQARTPLLGDPLYGTRVGSPVIVEAGRLIGRQALHAAELAFQHPVTGEALAFKAPPPDDFRRALDYLRGCGSGG
ncbi:MAG TPA: RluA family pseudouridine synthase, partial [Polyangiaceae bacterium]|nr:RluA family pseudouridine synthase [Polyangiaceae bacterium]